MRLRRSALVIVCLLAARSAPAQAPAPALQEDEAVRWLQSYIRVDTINPPGNEAAGVQFFKAILDAEGIPYETAESAQGRGNIWARLQGGDQPALLPLHHMDVVPANKATWHTDPLSGEIKDGYVYGRGALDTKSSGILHLAAFVALHGSKTTLNRDVIFADGSADEEAGGFFGVGWLVKNRPELFKGVGYVINEGASGQIQGGRTQFGIEVTQKVTVLVAPHSTRRAGSWIHSAAVLGRDHADCRTRAEVTSLSPPHASEWIEQLFEPAVRNVALAAETICGRPTGRKVIGAEQEVPERRVDREVLVDRLALGAVMPVMERGRGNEPRGAGRNVHRTLAWMKVACAATRNTYTISAASENPSTKMGT